ncbi:hypothetical protein D3C83_89900 [compost metagenome]
MRSVAGGKGRECAPTRDIDDRRLAGPLVGDDDGPGEAGDLGGQRDTWNDEKERSREVSHGVNVAFSLPTPLTCTSNHAIHRAHWSRSLS